jgi:glutamate carboxypeptidase
MTELDAYFQGQRDEMLKMLQELVALESPSHEKAAVDRMGSRVIELIRVAGGTVTLHARDQVGDLILGRWRGRHPGRPLLLCHMDTVWPLGTVRERPPHIENGLFYGAGAYDMKGGLVIALTALRGLGEMGLRPVAPVMLLCTGDEETGSHYSRELIEELAREGCLIICLEPGLPGGVVKTARKGVGEVTVTAKGKAAHAGADHPSGVNAVEEMAHQVLALQALTHYERGTTVSVGLIRGGTASNVVPAECQVVVDFRVATESEGRRLAEAFAGLRAQLPGACLQVEGGLNRPPMVRDALMVRTFEQARRIAGRHGIVLQEGTTGGASDGNFTAALGVPTLDGLGADGDGGHSLSEHVLIASLPARATLLAALLTQWEAEPG